ncbi:universal stress protein [Acidihalobacter prosperus]
MYQTILLAYDGTRQCRVALQEGADLAVLCGASTVLLSVMPLSLGLSVGEGFNAGEILNEDHEYYQNILNEGVGQLHKRGLNAQGRLVLGDPVEQITHIALEVEADLVVIGHNRRSVLSRWWRSSLETSLLDALQCSILVAQTPDKTKANALEEDNHHAL